MARLTAVLAVAMSLASMTATAAEAPVGARLAIVERGPSRSALTTLDPGGANAKRLLSAKAGQRLGLSGTSTAAWSPDGEALAFTAIRGKRRSILLVPASGEEPQVIRGTQGGFFPVFSPDGRKLAFARFRRRQGHRTGNRVHWHYESASVWIVDLASGEAHRITRWRNDLEHYPTSFSSDGLTLLVNRYDQERSGAFEVVALHFDDRTSGLLVDQGLFPTYSPDGSKIVMAREAARWIRAKPGQGGSYSGPNGAQWRSLENYELYLIDADGANLHRLTHSPRRDEIFADWDPSGNRIAYTGRPSNANEGRWSLMQMNSDGTCTQTLLVGRRVSYEFPAWQPGPGREAGRIAC